MLAGLRIGVDVLDLVTQVRDVVANTWTKNVDRIEHEHNLRNFDSYAIPPPRIELFKKFTTLLLTIYME
jgi:hypothetical protein